MNDTYELYKSGRSIVDLCNAELEAKMPLTERKDKMPLDGDTLKMAKAAIELLKAETSWYAETRELSKAFLASINGCEAHVDAGEVSLLVKLVENRELRVKQHDFMKEMLGYFVAKVSRQPAKSVVIDKRLVGDSIIYDFDNGDSETHKYETFQQAKIEFNREK